MKRLFTLLLLSLATTSLMADVVEKVYYFSKPTVEHRGSRQLLSFDNTSASGIAGEPVLPYQAINLLLPPGHEAVRISYECFDETVVTGFFKLEAAQYSRPLSEPGIPVLIENEEVYRSNEVYPASQTGNLSTQYMNGYAFAQSVFTPVSYLPAKGEIKYFARVVIRIETRETSRGLSALKNLSPAASVKKSCLRSA
ncbi:MAG: hypothetical protein HGA37_14380, partial [Lentimicrobium sp.]|nr:hypothetical protein [Lentimicrobium sp.]